MPELNRPERLTHGGADTSDARLAAEAATHLAKFPALQLMAELLTRLREMQLPWWTPEHLRKAYGARERMAWLVDRPDVRQRVTTELTGLAPKAARKKSPDFQSELIDSVIDDGDISPAEFEASFDPLDLAVYGPTADLWRLFRRRMPWEDDATPHQDLVGWLIGALLADKGALDGTPRTPILTPWSVRTAIDGRVWHSRIPLDVRVEIDEARLKREKERPHEPFHAGHDLAHAPPALIAASIPLKDLVPVLDVAARAMGFDDGDIGSSPGRGPGSLAPSPYGAASARPSAGPFAERRDAPPDEESAEPPGGPSSPSLEDLPSVGDDEDPLARTNPWELEAVPSDPIGDVDGSASPGAPSVTAGGRRGARKRR